MTIRDKVRKWLGFIELEAYIAGLEKASRERHDLEMEQFLLIANILDRTHILLQERHVNRKPPTSFVQDWEQVQLEELATMLANQPKEEN